MDIRTVCPIGAYGTSSASVSVIQTMVIAVHIITAWAVVLLLLLLFGCSGSSGLRSVSQSIDRSVGQ
jgi:hypothetical protein